MRAHRVRELNRNVAGARAAYLRVATVVANATGVPFAEIVALDRRGRPSDSRAHTGWRSPKSFARQAAIYLTVVACDVRQGALARALGRPRVRILWACRSAEDARERVDIDELFQRIEAMI